MIMGNYDLENFDNTQVNKDENEEPKKKSHFLLAFLVGLVTSVLVANVLAFITMLIEAEFFILLILGGLIVSSVIIYFVPHNSWGGALIGLILCPATYLLYQVILTKNGYGYNENGGITTFLLFVGSIAFGAYMGYNKKKE